MRRLDVRRVVGLPGTLCAPSIFDPLGESLRRLEPAVDVQGLSWMTGPGPWDLPTVAARIADDIRAGGPTPVVVLGHSTGGALALQLALSEPLLVAGLVLFSTGPHMRDHGDVGAIIQTLRDRWGHELRESVLRRSFAALPSEDAMRRFRAYAASRDRAAVLGILTSQRDTDFSDRLGSLECPVAVVHGLNDPVRTIDQARAFADALPDADVTTLSCGHSAPFESPDEAASVVLRVLMRGGRQVGRR